MSTLKNIVWLASYPKSGNTWTRIFLTNYLLNPDAPVPINRAQQLTMGDASVELYRKVAGPAFDPLHPLAHLRFRAPFLKAIANNGADMNLVKTHNINTSVERVPLITPAYSRSAIYILRHPFDVAISYARHFGMTPAAACRSICRSDNTTKAMGKTIKQFIGSWADHVTSWADETAFPVHVMRYEDMRHDPVGAFTGMLEALGFPLDTDRVEKAVRFSSFKELQAQEARDGFVEASSQTDRFFHTGTSGQWEGVLTQEDIDHLTEVNGKVMERFGYA